MVRGIHPSCPNVFQNCGTSFNRSKALHRAGNDMLFVWRFKLEMSASEVLELVRRSNSSPTAVVNALVSKAFQDVYDLTGKLLISSESSVPSTIVKV